MSHVRISKRWKTRRNWPFTQADKSPNAKEPPSCIILAEKLEIWYHNCQYLSVYTRMWHPLTVAMQQATWLDVLSLLAQTAGGKIVTWYSNSFRLLYSAISYMLEIRESTFSSGVLVLLDMRIDGNSMTETRCRCWSLIKSHRLRWKISANDLILR